MEQKKIWSLVGDRYYLTAPVQEFESLEPAIYQIQLDGNNIPFLTKISNNFEFDYKLYGLESDLIERVLRTYHSSNFGNLGILLNGVKGTGKTVTAKILCNSLKQPVIIVEAEGFSKYLNTIPQDITIFVDEYEKIYQDSSELLTIMDGALNSQFRRVFILTTNDLTVERNLLQRPSRIRYLKKFDDLKPSLVEEIVDDILQHKKFKADCIRFISTLQLITVDIVKAILNEVNIHNESPDVFGHIFNIAKLSGKYDVLVQNNKGDFITVMENLAVNPSPLYQESNIRDHVRIGDEYLGRVKTIVDHNTIEVLPDSDDKRKKPKWFNKKGTTIKIEKADVKHYNYTYGSKLDNKTSQVFSESEMEWD